jgi:hypothetical protein
MPERWETQIRKLRDVEPGPDLGTRFEEGPRGEPTPPTRQRIVAAVTALALFVAAGVFAVRVFGPGPEENVIGAPGDEASLVLELSSNDGHPQAVLSYGDERQAGVQEGYEWCDGGQCTAGIADFTHYPPVSGFVVVPPGTPIDVVGSGSVERLRISTLEDEPIEESGGPMAVPASNGVYAFDVHATWAGDPGGSANFFFGVQALDSPAAAPDLMRVECGPGYTVTDTAVVRTQADGLHVEVSGAEGIVAYSVIRGAGDPEEYAVVGSSTPNDVMPIPPASWEFACSEHGQQDDTDPTVAFELVDPDDHYAPFELSCDDPTEQGFTSTIPGATPHADTALMLVTGLQEGDRLRGAGYGAETWKSGPAYVVDRGGQSVARLMLGAGSDPWAGTFTACEGSGITLTETLGPTGSIATLPPEPSPSPSPGDPAVPDVLIVRCEGLGPAVDSTEVRLQEDGLHVEATNVADAEVVEIRAGDPGREAFIHQTAFESVGERIVIGPFGEASWPSGSGHVWVGCRVSDENGEIVGGPSEVPDAYVLIEVLPAD